LRTTALGAIGALILTAAAAPAVAGGYYDIGPQPGYAPPCPPPRPPCRRDCIPAPPPQWREAPPPGWGGPPPPDEGYAPAGYDGDYGDVGGYVGSGEVIEGGPGFGIDYYGGFDRFDHGRRRFDEREREHQRGWSYESQHTSEHAQTSAHVSEQAHISEQTHVQARTYVHASGGWHGGGWGRR